MAHIGFADKNRGGKMKRILRANNSDVDIQMHSCDVLLRGEMRAALRSVPILQAQINIKGGTGSLRLIRSQFIKY